MSLPVITLASASRTSISRTSFYENGENCRDPSFSSYLSGACQQLRKEQPWNAAPSLHSESSQDSQSALLHTVPRNQKPRRTNEKHFLASIGCSCSCGDKNSVKIDASKGVNCSTKSTSTRFVNAKSKQQDKTSGHLVNNSQLDFNCLKFDELGQRVNSGSHLGFPVFNPKNGNQAAKMQVQDKNDCTKRKPLEVFGSAILGNGKSFLSLEKRLTMLTWDAIAPGSEEQNRRIPSISRKIHNDSDSDASSALFEIESFSKGSTQASDGISPIACYAPSEASIDWSVITASADDFSILSDSEELKSTATATTTTMLHIQSVGLSSKNGRFKEMPKRRSSILSGCKSQKSVRVAGDAHTPK